MCSSPSDSPDPVAVTLDETKTMMLDLKWAYPPKDGVPQGKYCWYCCKCVEVGPEYIGQTMSAVREAVIASEEARKKFDELRNVVVQIAVDIRGDAPGSW